MIQLNVLIQDHMLGADFDGNRLISREVDEGGRDREQGMKTICLY